MTVKNVFLLFCLVLSIGVLLACATLRSGYAPPLQHPQEEGEDYSMCTDCHDVEDEEFPYQRFNHTSYFAAQHRQVVYQAQEACYMCHTQSYCNDCHGVWTELKPSVKDQTDTRRWMPHRGDYLTRHIIDARINPAPCFRCHGNRETAKTCRPCHG